MQVVCVFSGWGEEQAQCLFKQAVKTAEASSGSHAPNMTVATHLLQLQHDRGLFCIHSNWLVSLANYAPSGTREHTHMPAGARTQTQTHKHTLTDTQVHRANTPPPHTHTHTHTVTDTS